jgi:hypothetical protein
MKIKFLLANIVSVQVIEILKEGKPNARTLLASPLSAAAAAITGVVSDVREMYP